MSQRAAGPRPRPPIRRRVPRREFERQRWHGGLMFGENVTTGERITEDGQTRLTEAGTPRRVENVQDG